MLFLLRQSILINYLLHDLNKTISMLCSMEDGNELIFFKD